MKHYPTVLSIAGSNNTSEAGIQSDIKTISVLGAYATTVITAIAVFNKKGIEAIHSIPSGIIRNQIEFVMEHMWPDVVKIGLIANAESARVVADCLRKYHPKYVVYDPVMFVGEKMSVPDDETLKIIKDELLHFSNLMTINLNEATVFTGIVCKTKEDVKETARVLAEQYLIPILVKAANFLGDETYDVLYVPDGESWEFFGKKMNTTNLHGASSLLSASVATQLALGNSLNWAVKVGREFTELAINNPNYESKFTMNIPPEYANSVLMRNFYSK